MVVTLVWVDSWIAATISLFVLVILVVLLVCCVCWEGKGSSINQFYLLDEKGLKKSASEVPNNGDDTRRSSGFFRRFSTDGKFKATLGMFTPKSSASPMKSSLKSYDLNDSYDILKNFDQAILQLEGNERRPTYIDLKADEDVLSCFSNDSKHTFYSIYPINRTTSMAETMRSATSNPDFDNLLA